MADDGDVLVFEAEHEAPVLSWGHRAQTDVALLRSKDARFARVALFKVEKWQPSLLKQIKGACTTSLAPSDIAVTLFPVLHVGQGSGPGEQKLLYTTGVPQGPEGSFAGAVALVGEALFMSNVFRFETLPGRVYLWEGPLQGESQKEMDAIAQVLMSADAVPGSGKRFKSVCPVQTRKRTKNADPQLKLLQRLAAVGWVECEQQEWSFTHLGCSFVRTCFALAQPVSVLQPRFLEDRSKWTRFEMLLFLRGKGWVALPIPKKKKGLRLCLALPDTHEAVSSSSSDVGVRPGRTWFFGNKPPQASKSYLLAMVAIEEHRQALIVAGVASILHAASVAYYDCVLRVASGDSSAADLLALEPGVKTSCDVTLEFEAHEPGPSSLKEMLAKNQMKGKKATAKEDPSERETHAEGVAGLDDDRDHLSDYSPSQVSARGIAQDDDDDFEGVADAALVDADVVEPLVDPGLPPLEDEVQGEAAASDPPAGPVGDLEDEGRPERQRRAKTHSWGCFLITYKVQQPSKKAASSSKGPKAKYSWQATCNMPEHNPAGERSKCTKTMSFNSEEPNAEKLCLWRIRRWCNSCGMFASKKEHQAFHPDVDDLPDEAAIVACRLESFLPPAPTPPVPARKRKRAPSPASSSSSSSSSSDSSTEP